MPNHFASFRMPVTPTPKVELGDAFDAWLKRQHKRGYPRMWLVKNRERLHERWQMNTEDLPPPAVKQGPPPNRYDEL